MSDFERCSEMRDWRRAHAGDLPRRRSDNEYEQSLALWYSKASQRQHRALSSRPSERQLTLDETAHLDSIVRIAIEFPAAAPVEPPRKRLRMKGTGLGGCGNTPMSQMQRRSETPAQNVLTRILAAKLCPKAFLRNISEWHSMEKLFEYAKLKNWTEDQKSGTFVVARGIRGREGVQVLLDHLKIHDPLWEDNSFVDAFVEMFENRWKEEVARTGKVSALSHQEQHHAGLSGMKFVNTLKSMDHRAALFKTETGLASRLSPFFRDPDLESLDADHLMAFYWMLVKVPMVMRLNKPDSNRTPAAVSDGSYNSMDFLRCFSNIATQVFNSHQIRFTPRLWEKMLQCQAHPASTRELLAFFEVDMAVANGVIASNPEMNWTTLLVCLCEVRQAMGNDREAFIQLLEQVESRPHLASFVDAVTIAIVKEGAHAKNCYCVRLCAKLRAELAGDRPLPANPEPYYISSDDENVAWNPEPHDTSSETVTLA